MNKDLLDRLSQITDEEKAILAGQTQINRAIYYRPSDHVSEEKTIDSSLVLKNGKMIDIRPHVRFVHFPEHTHNFVEFVYMCKGTTTHIIDGNRIELKEGDLLFLNQHAVQEILPAGRDDIAVNFMILPQFFDTVFAMLGNEESALRSFIVSCLTDKDMGGNYLYYDVAGILPVQNLMENLIYTMMNDSPQKRNLAQITMGLLFVTMTDYADRIHVSGNSYEEDLMIRLLSYIETQSDTASLSKFAAGNSIDIYSLSRLIKKKTGSTFRELLMGKRLNRACFLLKNTRLSASEIAAAIGYENAGFFHRVFKKIYGMTPGEYRKKM